MSIFCDETAPENIVKSSNPRIFTTYCLFHLGDHIYNMNLFRQIEDLLRETNRKIHYYCPSQYHEQVVEFSPSADVFELFAMCDLDRDAILDKGLVPGGFSPLHELHIGNQRLPKHLFNRTHILLRSTLCSELRKISKFLLLILYFFLFFAYKNGHFK